MISKGLFNYSLYRLFKNIYNNYLSVNNEKTFKQKLLINNNVTKIKYDYKYTNQSR